MRAEKPHKYSNNARDEKVNKIHHPKARNKLERTFRCQLKGGLCHYNHENAPYIMYACCILHNTVIEGVINAETESESIDSARERTTKKEN